MGSFKAWLCNVLCTAGKRRLEELGVKELLSTEDLDAALEASTGQAVFILKHSTRCPISSAAYRRVAGYLEEAAEAAPPFYLLKVIEARPVSNAITERLSVTHQSPQIILIKDSTAQWNASHGGITSTAINEALAAL